MIYNLKLTEHLAEPLLTISRSKDNVDDFIDPTRTPPSLRTDIRMIPDVIFSIAIDRRCEEAP